MNKLEKEEFVKKSCRSSVKLVNLINDLFKLSSSLDTNEEREVVDVLVSDLKVNPTVEEAKQYTQIGLWKKIQRRNKQAFFRLDKYMLEKKV